MAQQRRSPTRQSGRLFLVINADDPGNELDVPARPLIEQVYIWHVSY